MYGVPEAILIQQASGADAALLAVIHRHGFGEKSWPEQTISSLLQDSAAKALLARVEGSAAGFILYRRMQQEAEILTLAVSPEVRRCGVATALLQRMEAEVADHAVQQLWLEVGAANHAACALYRREGYELCGIRRGYYLHADGRHEDAALMRKWLTPPEAP